MGYISALTYYLLLLIQYFIVPTQVHIQTALLAVQLFFQAP